MCARSAKPEFSGLGNLQAFRMFGKSFHNHQTSGRQLNVRHNVTAFDSYSDGRPTTGRGPYCMHENNQGGCPLLI